MGHTHTNRGGGVAYNFTTAGPLTTHDTWQQLGNITYWVSRLPVPSMKTLRARIRAGHLFELFYSYFVNFISADRQYLSLINISLQNCGLVWEKYEKNDICHDKGVSLSYFIAKQMVAVGLSN